MNKKLLRAFFITHLRLSFIFLLFLACSNNKNESNKHLNNAKLFYDKNDYLSSVNEIEIAKKIDSSNLEIAFWEAKIKIQMKNYDLSTEILNKLIRKNYKADTCLKLIADNYFTIGHNYENQKSDKENADKASQKAVNFYDSTLNKNNLYFEAYIGKIRALHNLERHDDAISIINNIFPLFPETNILTYYRGIEKLILGDRIGGFNDLTSAINSKKLDSINMATAYRFRSLANISKDSIDRAIEDLTIAISYNPLDKFLYATRGHRYRDKNLKEKACIDFRKAGDLGLTSIYEEIRDYCDAK